MKDTQGRTIDYLRLSVTDLCNYRCRYCMPESGIDKREHSDILSVEELAEAAAAAVRLGVRKIRLTGGEPLARRGILDICRALRAIPELEELCLTTNGSLLPGCAGALRGAGVDRVNISLDTLRPDRFTHITRGGSLRSVLDGIAAAEQAGFRRLKLNVVLIGGFNSDETEDFVRLTLSHPWEIRFIELMPMAVCRDWDRSCFLPGNYVLEKNPSLEEISPEGVARRYRLPGAAGTVGLISPVSHEFCSGCRRIRITADGRLKGCLHSAEELSLRGLHGRELEEIILQSVMQKPVRHRLSHWDSQTCRTMSQIGG